MNRKAQRIPTHKRGMTLSEVVVSIGVIAFSIPLILAATGGAHRSLQAADADTRSSWLVRDVQRRIISAWSDSASPGQSEMAMAFPSAATPEVKLELSYKQDGTFLAEDTKQAAYRVTVEAEPYMTASQQGAEPTLALVSIRIEYPAKASANKRKKLSYQFISTRDGIP